MKILMLLSNPFVVDPRVYKEAKTLMENGHEVSVIVWDRKKEYREEETVEGIHLIRIHNTGLMKVLPNDIFRNPLWWRKAYKKALDLFKEGFRFDIVHCHDLDTLKTGVWLKTKTGCKLIYDAHEIFGYMISMDISKIIVKAVFRMEKKLMKNVDHIITVNKPLEDYFKSITDKPITIVMNCKDLISEKYQPPKNDVFTICYIGVLYKSRMFPEIVDIIGGMKDVKFVIAGRKVHLYEEVKERCKKYDNVEFLGTTPFSEVIPKTLGSNAVICMFDPKNKNNQVGVPNKIFEGMIAGRPIIVTKGLYYSRLVGKEKCGLSVDYSEGGVKEAVIKLRDNPQFCEELGKNGLKATIRKYNWKKQSEKLLKTYEGLK